MPAETDRKVARQAEILLFKAAPRKLHAVLKKSRRQPAE